VSDDTGSLRFRRDEGDRGLHMELRLERAAKKAGVPGEGLELLARAHTLAMEPRRTRLGGQRHPDFLHPGRSALILLLDAAVAEPLLLAGATLAESEREDLRVPGGRIAAALGEAVAGFVTGLPSPVPDGPDLMELLVTAEDGARLVALAERLDHLRHAHLWTDLAARRAAHAQAVEVWAPVAARTHPRLADRYRWWIGMFSRRHL